MLTSSGSFSCCRLNWPGLVLLALAANQATVDAFAFQPFRSGKSFHRSNVITTFSAVVPDLVTETASPTTSSRSDFWGQDRSIDEIKLHLTSANLNINADDVEVLSASPPVVVIHNLLTKDQCHAIMDGAIHQQMQRSTTYIITYDEDNDSSTSDSDSTAAADTTVVEQLVASDIRTSSTVWLRDDEDDDDDAQDKGDSAQPTASNHDVSLLSQTLRQVADYTSHMSGLPPHYMENLQVVRYLPGQEFQVHTDHLDSFNELERGGRLATCLFYLKSPTRGGATYFPEVDVEVVPRRGSALFFWNTLEKPGCPEYQDTMFLHADERVRHAGLPVIEGEKWICNRWVHPVDYGAGVRGL